MCYIVHIVTLACKILILGTRYKNGYDVAILERDVPDHNEESLRSALETSDFNLSRAIGIILEGLDIFTAGSPN